MFRRTDVEVGGRQVQLNFAAGVQAAIHAE